MSVRYPSSQQDAIRRATKNRKKNVGMGKREHNDVFAGIREDRKAKAELLRKARTFHNAIYDLLNKALNQADRYGKYMMDVPSELLYDIDGRDHFETAVEELRIWINVNRMPYTVSQMYVGRYKLIKH